LYWLAWLIPFNVYLFGIILHQISARQKNLMYTVTI
jgi:hypothetical protein